MKVIRLYTGNDGESHFGDIEIPLDDIGGMVRASQLVKAKGVMFRENDLEYKTGWKNAPSRRLFIALEGTVEIEAGDGDKRVFGPGEFYLAEDTTGRGHIARSVGRSLRRSIVVILE